MTVSMGFGGWGRMFGGSSTEDPLPHPVAAEDPASRQVMMSKEADHLENQEDACALEEQVVKSTEVVVDDAQQEKEQQVPEEEEEELCSSVLIEAQIALDDGSVEVLRLRAVDRSVDVAAKFLRDHNLKEQQFKEPLTAWLKSVESSAETFPVKAKGDLFEIRQEFSKKKQDKGKDAWNGTGAGSM